MMTPGRDVGRSLWRWFLLTGDRRAVVLALLFSVYVALVPIGLFEPSPMTPLLAERGSVAALLNTLLSGVILLVSIVVSVASLVVSKELTPVGRQRERIEQSREFRRQTEEILDREVSPAEPAAFLRSVTRAVLTKAQALDDAVDSPPGGHPGVDEAVAGDLESEVDAFLDAVAADAERVNRTIRSAEFGTFEMLLTALEYDYAQQLYALRRLRSRHGEQLSEEATAAVEELMDALEYFLAGREYFKSLYYEREFANLSSDLLYVSMPAIVVVSYAILAVDLQFISGATLGVSHVLLFAGAAYTVALGPFAVLTAYVLRVAAVAKKTLSAGPFILEENGDGLLE